MNLSYEVVIRAYGTEGVPVWAACRSGIVVAEEDAQAGGLRLAEKTLGHAREALAEFREQVAAEVPLLAVEEQDGEGER